MIIIPAVVFGLAGDSAVRLALDTTATETVISRRVLRLIGCAVASAPTASVVMGGGTISVPLVTVDRLEALGQVQTGLTVQAHTLPSSLLIDGLLGLDFLRGHRLVIDFRTGHIILE